MQGARIKKRAQTEGSKGEFDAPPVPVHGWKIVVQHRSRERPVSGAAPCDLSSGWSDANLS